MDRVRRVDLIRVPEPPSAVSSSFKDGLREFTPFNADREALAEDGDTLRAVAFGPDESL